MRQSRLGVVIAVSASAVIVGGCQTWGPTWSELTGVRYTAVALDRRPALLVQVGDRSVGREDPYKVAPGKYEVVVQAPPHGPYRGFTKTMTLLVEPCRRYYINAQFEGRTGPAWQPVIDYVEPIAGCRVPAG